MTRDIVHFSLSESSWVQFTHDSSVLLPLTSLPALNWRVAPDSRRRASSRFREFPLAIDFRISRRGSPTSSPALSSATDWLEVVRIGRADWRVSDARREAGDTERLLGFVERLGRARFEVVWMSDPLRWAYVATLPAAVAALRDRDEFPGLQLYLREETRPRRKGPRPWEY